VWGGLRAAMLPRFAMPFATRNALHRRVEAAPTLLPGPGRASCRGHQSSHPLRQPEPSTYATLVLTAARAVRLTERAVGWAAFGLTSADLPARLP